MCPSLYVLYLLTICNYYCSICTHITSSQTTALRIVIFEIPVFRPRPAKFNWLATAFVDFEEFFSLQLPHLFHQYSPGSKPAHIYKCRINVGFIVFKKVQTTFHVFTVLVIVTFQYYITAATSIFTF